MSEQEVVELMKSSKSEEEWKANCDLVKSKCGGYPSFWYAKIVLSGLASQTAATWGSDAELHISAFTALPTATNANR
jgi:hypothetical protein